MPGGWSPARLLLVLGLLFGMQDMVISGWRSHQWVSYQTVSMGHWPCAAPRHASQYKGVSLLEAIALMAGLGSIALLTCTYESWSETICRFLPYSITVPQWSWKLPHCGETNSMVSHKLQKSTDQIKIIVVQLCLEDCCSIIADAICQEFLGLLHVVPQLFITTKWVSTCA